MKILVFLEAQNEGLKRISYEVISAARLLGGELAGVVLNASSGNVAEAAEYGLAEAYLANHDLLTTYSSTAAAKIVADVAGQAGADCIIFPANATGYELAPRVAAKLEAGYVADCVSLENKDGEIIAKKPVYAGKAMISTKANTPRKVYSIRPNVFTATKADTKADLNVNEFAPELSDADVKVKVTELAKNEGKLDVLEADVVVSGGRGIKGPENYYLIESLAEAFGAAVGASRAVVDAGWRPHSEQVGQTGKTVSPSLYVACGISGAVQHLAGMSSSKIIVAINKDKDAPIFKVADYGIVGDIFDVLPKLTEKLKSLN